MKKYPKIQNERYSIKYLTMLLKAAQLMKKKEDSQKPEN